MGRYSFFQCPQYIDMGYKEEEEIALQYIEFHYIELLKYKKKELLKFTKLDQWMCIFTQNEEGILMAEKENKEIKKAMLKKNMPIDVIVEITKLTKEEIEKL